jgi:hypothetical protein
MMATLEKKTGYSSGSTPHTGGNIKVSVNAGNNGTPYTSTYVGPPTQNNGTVTSLVNGEYITTSNGETVAKSQTLQEASQKSKEHIFGGKEGQAYRIYPDWMLKEGGTLAPLQKKMTAYSESRINYSEPKSPNIPNPVSISTQKAYEAGLISRNAFNNYQNSGVMELIVPQQMLTAANEARKKYPVENNPETKSSLGMEDWFQTYIAGNEQQKQDIISEAAPRTQPLYELTEGGLGLGYAFSFAKSRITGKSLDVWQSERLANTEAFMMSGYNAAEKGWTDETMLWGFSRAAPASETLAFSMFGSGIAGKGFQEATELAFGGMMVQQGAKTIKEPSQENMVESFLYAGTALFAKSAEVMGGSMKAAYGEWKAPKSDLPLAKSFSITGMEIAEPKTIPEDTALVATKSTYTKAGTLETKGNVFMITEDVGKISTPTLESRDIFFKAVTKMGKGEVVKTDITFGNVSKAAGKSMEKMLGTGKIETLLNGNFDVELTKGELMQIGRNRQQTLLGKELPKLELSEVLSIGRRSGMTDMELMQVKQLRNQPSTTDLSHKVMKIDTLFKGTNGKDMFEIDWVKAGNVKLSKSDLSAFQEKLKTQPFEPFPKWPKEWSSKWNIPENWPEVNLLNIENMAKLQKGFDEALKSFVAGVSKNRPGVEVKDIGKIKQVSGGIGKGFMKKLSQAEIPDMEDAFNLRPGDVKGIVTPELKEVQEFRLGKIMNFGAAEPENKISRQSQKQIEMLGIRTRLGMGGTEQGQKQKVMTLLGTAQETSFKQEVNTGTKESIASLLGMKSLSKQEQKQKQKTDTRLGQVPKFEKLKLPAPKGGLSFSSISGKGNSKLLAPGFLVKVRRLGRWIDLLDRPVSRSQALGFGSKYALETPGASFKVVRVDALVEDINDPTWKKVRGMFRIPKPKSSLGPDVQIEKNKFRINTPGEYQGITQKGLEAIRMRRNFKPRGRVNIPKFRQPSFSMGKTPGTNEVLFGKRKGRRSIWDL